MTCSSLRSNLLLILSVLMLALAVGCDSGSADEDVAGNCSIAFASPDDSYAQFVNLLDVHIEVVYDDRPLSATVSRRSCDLLGVLADRPERFTVRRCSSGDFDSEGAPVDCGLGGPTQRITAVAAAGEREVITVDDSFFE